MSKSIFLSKLGIPAIQQARIPTVDGFPFTFNTNNRNVWTQALEELGIAGGMSGRKTSGNPERDWGLAIRKYIELCADLGTFPFSNTQQAANDQVFHYLRVRRATVVKFMNLSKLLTMVTLRDSKRLVTMTTAGFTLEVHGYARLKDPTFQKYLQKTPYPRFNNVRDSLGRWVKPLGEGLTFWAANDGAEMTQRWIVGYTINCPIYPDVPGHHLPSKAQLERFVLDVLWMPILRSHRPDGVVHKLL